MITDTPLGYSLLPKQNSLSVTPKQSPCNTEGDGTFIVDPVLLAKDVNCDSLYALTDDNFIPISRVSWPLSAKKCIKKNNSSDTHSEFCSEQ